MNTFKIPIIITHAMNVFGPRQHTEKFIPMVVHKLLHDEPIKIHCYDDGKTPGSRFYIHSTKIAEAVYFLLQKGHIGESYNIRGQIEVDNEKLLLKIGDHMGIKPQYTLTHFDAQRPGHDLRYDISGDKLAELGFSISSETFESNLLSTLDFTINNKW